jgi:hypothetical protein
LLLSDIVMGGRLSGLQLAEILTAVRPDMCVLLMSVFDHERSVSRNGWHSGEVRIEGKRSAGAANEAPGVRQDHVKAEGFGVCFKQDRWCVLMLYGCKIQVTGACLLCIRSSR